MPGTIANRTQTAARTSARMGAPMVALMAMLYGCQSPTHPSAAAGSHTGAAPSTALLAHSATATATTEARYLGPTSPTPEMLAAQQALRDAKADTNNIRASEAKVRGAEQAIEEARKRLARARDQAAAAIDRAQRMRDIEVQQVKANHCCSECGNTESEINATGQAFQAHLVQVSGTSMRCAPSKLAEVKANWDNRIARLREQLESIPQDSPPPADLTRQLAEAQAELAAAKRDYQQAVERAQARVRESEAQWAR